MASKYTAETQPYNTPPDSDANAPTEEVLNRDAQDDVGVAGNDKSALKTGTRASYTPSYNADPYIGGKSGGKPAALGNVPSVVVGGASEVGQLPTMPGTLVIGEDKNVSTPVTG